MPAGNTYEEIFTETLASAQLSVNFTSLDIITPCIQQVYLLHQIMQL